MTANVSLGHTKILQHSYRIDRQSASGSDRGQHRCAVYFIEVLVNQPWEFACILSDFINSNKKIIPEVLASQENVNLDLI